MSDVCAEFLRLLDEVDSFAATEFAAKADDVTALVTGLDAAMRDSYWKRKLLARSINIGRAAAQLALINAARLTDAKAADDLRRKAKAICYNIASFAWRGWDEPGIIVTPADEAVGLDAARANLRLAAELKRGALPASRGHWMLGAQLISAGDFEGASSSFAVAAVQAAAAASKIDERLSIAFGWMSKVVQDESNAQAVDRFVASYGELQSLPEAGDFASQVTTALRVYLPSSPVRKLVENPS